MAKETENDATDLDFKDIAEAAELTVTDADDGEGDEGSGNGKHSKAHSKKGARKSRNRDGDEDDESEGDDDDDDDESEDEDDDEEDDESDEDDDESDEEDDEDSDDDDESEDEDDDEEDDESDEDDDESDEEDDDGEDDDEQPKTKTERTFLKRIGKLTAQKGELKEQLETERARIADLEEKLTKASPITLAPTPNDPLADIETEEALEERLRIAERVQTWCEDHPEGGTVTIDGKEVELDADDVKTRQRAARNILRAAGGRREFLKSRPAVLQDVKVFYPELLKTGSFEHAAMADLLKVVPELKRHPGLELLVGDMIEGTKLRFERYKQLQKKHGKAPEGKSKTKGKKSKRERDDKARGGKTRLPGAPKANSASGNRIPDKARKTGAARRLAKDGYSDEAAVDLLEQII